MSELRIECPPTWPAGAKLVIVGEAPGREEVEWQDCPNGHGGRAYPDICSVCQQAMLPAPRGWIGAAGRCMQKAAQVAKLPPWNEIALSNVAKRRPKDNKFFEEFYETVEEPIYTKTGKLSKRTKKITRKTAELGEWEDSLRQELQQHNPNLVVAAGNAALEAIVGYSGISNYRGSIVSAKYPRLDGTPFKVLAVEHPSYIIRGNMTDFWILAHDLEKARREMEFPEIRRERFYQFLLGFGDSLI